MGPFLDCQLSDLPLLSTHTHKSGCLRACRALTGRIGELKTQLDASTPNLKALEQYEAVKEKEKDLVGGV